MSSQVSKHLKIGQVASRMGVTTRTLRYYESLGLIEPTSRSPGGFRLYGDGAIAAVGSIQALKEAGLSLEQIRKLREATQTIGQVPAAEFLGKLGKELGKQRLEIRRQVETLQRRLRQFDRACDAMGRCPGCGGKQFDAGCLDCLTDKIPGFAQVLYGLLVSR